MRETLLAVVLGSPVSQSLSPAIHEAAFRAAGRHGRFEAWECDADGFGECVSRLHAARAVGASVTMPLKEVALGHCDVVDATARALNAVNCLCLSDGAVSGYNTDGEGCCEALVKRGGISLNGSEVVVLGAGGTARAIALALARRGASVAVVNRTESRARTVAELSHFVAPGSGQIRVGSRKDIAGGAVLVNATSVGMGTDDSPVEVDEIRPGATVLDVVYHPLETRLLREARRLGCQVVDGLWMLIEQARLQQLLWFGELPEAEPMRSESLRVLAARSN